MPQIPVISLNANGMETNPGFSFTLPMVIKAMQAVVYGDIFMRVPVSYTHLSMGRAYCIQRGYEKKG